jgi:hypothetical protein
MIIPEEHHHFLFDLVEFVTQQTNLTRRAKPRLFWNYVLSLQSTIGTINSSPDNAAA